MNWALGSSLYPQTKVAGPFHLLIPFPKTPDPRKRSAASEPLPDALPDYLVYVTRNALLAATTSLTKSSTEMHGYFTKLCQFLAYERFMRSVAAWWMPGMTPFYMNGVQPWMMAAPPQQPQMLLSFWGHPSAPKPAMPQFPFAATPNWATRFAAPQMPDYAAMTAMPAAFLAFAPTFFDAWRNAV